MRSIVLSKKFQENFPKQATLLFGAPDQSEILYPGEFERAGCQVVYALSNSKTLTNLWGKKLFDGRVTQYLERLPKTWNWHGTDFYLCGNGNMIDDVTAILTQSFGVNPSAIHAESFGVNSTPKELPVPEILRIAA
jgi:ferredoxin-NADP reductase